MAVERVIAKVKDVIPDLQDAHCGYCGRTVTMERIGPIVGTGERVRYGENTESVVFTTYVCPRSTCARPSVARFRVTESQWGNRSKRVLI
jgi:hypothetical protein